MPGKSATYPQMLLFLPTQEALKDSCIRYPRLRRDRSMSSSSIDHVKHLVLVDSPGLHLPDGF